MLKQKINLVVDWLLSMRKRLSEARLTVGKWCSQKVQHFHSFMKSGRINKVVKKTIPNESKSKPKKAQTKTSTAKKKKSTTTTKK